MVMVFECPISCKNDVLYILSKNSNNLDTITVKIMLKFTNYVRNRNCLLTEASRIKTGFMDIQPDKAKTTTKKKKKKQHIFRNKLNLNLNKSQGTYAAHLAEI